jgi:uncharacterized protein (TIGR03083 family)
MLAASVRSLLAYDKHEVVGAMRAQRARTLALTESLPASAWDTIATPGWRIREVVAHLISTDEAALTGRLLAFGLRPVPMEDIEAWNERQVLRWADRPIPSLLHGLDRWGRRFARAFAIQPQAVAGRAIPTPFGRVSLLWLGMLRVYDEWVHGEDMRRATGHVADDASASVAPVGRHLLAALPFQTLPRIPEGATGSVTLRFSDLDLPAIGIEFLTRRYGVGLAGEGTTITVGAAPFVMVAAGRDAWRDAESGGAISIEGERGPAQIFLDALRVV